MNDKLNVKVLTAADVDRLRQSGTAQVVDVRLPFDYFGGRIPGAINLPGTSVISRGSTVITAGKTVIFICDDGAKSQEAALAALTVGFSDVAILGGGYDAWLDADLPTETISEGVFPKSVA